MAQPMQQTVPVTKVEVGVRCRNLKNRDTLSKSDPMCVLFISGFGTDKFTEFGRTEVIQDTLNPDFVHKFVVDYYFEQVQKLRFDVYDSDSSSAALNRHDFLGSMECTLAELVSRTKVEKALTGHGGKLGWGHIVVRAEEVAHSKERAHYQFSATKVDKKDFLGKSDPFLVISRANEDGSYAAVDKTEVVKNNLSPTWRPRSLHLNTMCNGDHHRSLKVDCYDWDSDGGHDFIGSFVTSVKELMEKKSFELINPKKASKKKGYKNSGVINVLRFNLTTEYTFLDYIQGGTQINFTVAVDFTQSNGQPHLPNSLHHMAADGMNSYTRALLAVGGIVEEYDTDKQFPALGFGGKLPNGTISHEFFLNGTPSPFCMGMSGVIQAYHQALRSVQLWGPTNFSPVINHVAKFAHTMSDGSAGDRVPGHNYFILLILTDGVITDMPQTKQAIVAASQLPMSIIIVGIGDADFSAMEELDADGEPLRAGGMIAQRDIVQFVPMRQFQARGHDLSIRAHLAKEVLAEVPDQFLQYMRAHGVAPMQRAPPQQAQAPPQQAQALSQAMPVQPQQPGAAPYPPQ